MDPLPPWQRRPTSGDVVALGDGQVGTKQHTFELKGGETVLYRCGPPPAHPSTPACC